MYKTVIVLVAVLAVANCFLVLPPACTTGAGSAVQILTYVTNLTFAVTELTPNQPYNLTAGCTYNVTFAFIPLANTSVSKFNVTAILAVDGEDIESLLVSGDVPAFSATTVATVLNFCTALQRTLWLVKCLLTSVLDLLLMPLFAALNCAGDVLAQAILANVPSQAAATVMIDVPNLANGTALFIGTVGDNSGNVVACKQGIINIIGEA